MGRARYFVLVAVLAAFAAAGSPAPAAAAPPTLTGKVGPGFTITLRDAAFKPVKILTPGTYRIVVTDKSSFHNFRLKGPGIDREITSLRFKGRRTITVRLRAGTYRFVCDPHLSSMHGSFKVAAATRVKPPVVKLKAPGFGDILATTDRRALYYWNVEKRDFKVHCTGSCAKAWPPLLVRSVKAVPKKVPGIRGSFGVIRRPDGKLQVTHNRLPLYTYAHEGPNQVLCDDVNGWFVVRL